MHRKSSIMNACVVSNRGCNLRCDHCYIEPELLASKGHIAEDTFRLVFDRIEEIYDLDQRVKKVALEILGGEITVLPLEWWKRNIPYVLSRSKDLSEKTGARTVAAFCTNMMLKDEGYIHLFNESFDDPNFDLFISWEPDTNRYGSRGKLESRWKSNVSRINSNKTKSICLIPTKGLIEDYGIDRLFSEIIIPMGIKDISTDMLYQFGSGAEFFRSSQPTFKQVADWYIGLDKKIQELGLNDINLSPKDEIYGSLKNDSAFHCMGNDLYDIEFEPDGTTTLNSSMTGSESMSPSRTLQISDPLWAIKFLFENTSEMDKKYSSEYDFCFQCEYLSYCNGGYYHYHMLPSDRLDQLMSGGECPGFKSYWDYCRDKIGDQRADVGEVRHLDRVKEIIKNHRDNKKRLTPAIKDIAESSINDYDDYFREISNAGIRVLIDCETHLGKNLSERIWFYDSIGANVSISEELLSKSTSTERLIKNIVNNNYLSFTLPYGFCLEWAQNNLGRPLSNIIMDSLSAVASKEISGEPGKSTLASGLIVDPRNDEILRWASQAKDYCLPEIKEVELTKESFEYVRKLEKRILSEKELIARFSL